jgi:sortase A
VEPPAHLGNRNDVIDNSGSMLGRREKVVRAALAFVGASHAEDELFVINFNEKVQGSDRERSRPRSGLRVAQRVFLWLGLAILASAGGTAVYADIAQRFESWRFDRDAAAANSTAREEEAVELEEGDPIGRLLIPRIGISVMVLQGIEDATLIAGAGHVPGTPSPGGHGNVVIAAHRDTFFRKLEGIRPGDRIRIATWRHVYEYVVESMETVDPEDTRVMESRDGSELTLITCYPFYFVGSAPKRFIVHARPLAGSARFDIRAHRRRPDARANSESDS